LNLETPAVCTASAACVVLTRNVPDRLILVLTEKDFCPALRVVRTVLKATHRLPTLRWITNEIGRAHV